MRMFSYHAVAEVVKRAHPDASGYGANQVVELFGDVFGGFVGKGDGHDFMGLVLVVFD